MRAGLIAAAGAALMTWHAPARAQSASDAGPPVHTLVSDGSSPVQGQMRSAAPIGDVTTWLTTADIPDEISTEASKYVAHPSRPILLARVSLMIMVESDDSLSECRAAFGNSDLVPSVCARVRARGHFRHPLMADGTPTRGQAWITVQYSLDGPGGTTLLPRQLPPPPRILWPVYDAPYRAVIVKTPEWRTFAKVRDRRVVAISLSFADGRLDGCELRRSSGNQSLDGVTCLAARTGAYSVTPAAHYQRVPMMVHWDKEGVRVVLPLQEKAQSPTPTGPSPLIIHGAQGDAGASAWLEIDETGAVTECKVSHSGGSDAADLAMCRTLRATRFNPGRDVFGEPIADFYRADVRFQ
jgi:hypothetical protein